jgi:hypothetical protein
MMTTTTMLYFWGLLLPLDLGLTFIRLLAQEKGASLPSTMKPLENMNQDAEETETGNQAKDEDDSVDGGEEVVQVVQDPVAPPRSYTCGRCSEGIDLDSTFYRCVGHSCRGAFILKRQSSIF